MAEVSVSAHWEDKVSPGIKTMADNVGRATGEATKTTREWSGVVSAASDQLNRNAQAMSVARGALQSYSREIDPARAVTDKAKASIEGMARQLGLSATQAQLFAKSVAEDTNAGRGLDESLKRASSTLRGSTADNAAYTQSVGSMTSGLASLAAQLGIVYFSWRALRDGIVGTLKAQAEAYDADLRLANLLEVTRAGTEANAKATEAWADQLRSISGVSDETIKNMVGTAVALGLTREQAEKFAQAAVTLHNRLGKDLDESFSQLTLTLDGTAGRFVKLIPGMDQLTEAQLRAGQAADVIIKRWSSPEALGIAGTMGKTKSAFGELREEMGRTFAGGEEGAKRDIRELNIMASVIDKITLSLRVLRESNTKFTLGGAPFVPGSSIPGPAPKGLDIENQRAQSIAEFGGFAHKLTDSELQLQKAYQEATVKLTSSTDIFSEYLKAFDPKIAYDKTKTLLDAHKSLTDAQGEVAKILNGRKPVEEDLKKAEQALADTLERIENDSWKSAKDMLAAETAAITSIKNRAAVDDLIKQSAKDWAKMLGNDGMVLAEAEGEAAKQAREMAERFKKTQPAPQRFDLPAIRGNLNEPNLLGGNLPTAQAQRALEAINNAWLKSLVKQDEELRRNIALADDLGHGIADAFIQGIQHAQNFGDVLEQIFMSIINNLENAAGSALGNFISGAIQDFIIGGAASVFSGGVNGGGPGTSGPMGTNIHVGTQSDIAKEIQGLRSDLRQRIPDINQAQINKAVASVLLPEFRKQEARR